MQENGVKIAILSYTEFTNMGRGGDTSSFCVPLLREDTLREQIPLAKQVSDIVLVSVHWGNENSFETSVNQRRFASLMCEWILKAVLGVDQVTDKGVVLANDGVNLKAKAKIPYGDKVFEIANA
jgi:poly-gamma-glutamate synthesis protein (capsule biosynthesis protein)